MQRSGKTTYFTLQSYYGLAALYEHLGRLAEAEQYMRIALTRAEKRENRGFWPDAAVARTEFHLSKIVGQNSNDNVEARVLTAKSRSVLSHLLPFDSLEGVAAKDELALFGHLQLIFVSSYIFALPAAGSEILTDRETTIPIALFGRLEALWVAIL
ncbi:hypothetical protein BDZ45DRAFT_748303 [Acephala macrosclerotiorum]|nr:hypothetical protein BDZ45DRAFT_748303 [Acephala macrosclerotiorum]